MAVLVLTYSGFKLSLVMLRGRPTIMTTTFWLFIYTVGGLTPLAQTLTGLRPYLRDESTYLAAQILIAVAMLSFDLGSLISRTRNPKHQSPTRRLASDRLWPGTWFAIAGAALYVGRLGDPKALFESRRDLALSFEAAGLRENSQVQSAILNAFGQVPAIVVLVAWLLHYAHVPDSRTSSARTAIALLAVVNIVVNNPISNSRYWFAAVLLGLAYSLLKLRPQTMRWFVVIAVAFAVVVFPYSDYFRNTVEQRNLEINTSISEKMSTKDYDQTVMTANGIWYAQTFGHTNGRQILGVALFFVPRSQWPDKPVDTGVLIGENLPDAGTTNLSSPIWIEVWLDFSWPGLVLALGLLGFVVARSDARYHMRYLDRHIVRIDAFLAPFLAGYMFIILRGPLLQAMSRLTILLAVAWLLTRRDPDATSIQKSF